MKYGIGPKEYSQRARVSTTYALREDHSLCTHEMVTCNCAPLGAYKHEVMNVLDVHGCLTNVSECFHLPSSSFSWFHWVKVDTKHANRPESIQYLVPISSPLYETSITYQKNPIFWPNTFGSLATVNMVNEG